MEFVEVDVDGQNVRGVLENPSSDSLVVLVHGFTGNLQGPSNIFELLSNHLQDEGLAVLRCNFRGTPPSDMSFQEMTVRTETQDLRAVLDYAESTGFDDVSVVSESMGGAVVANVLPWRFSSMVFWYPAFDLKDTSLTSFLDDSAQTSLGRHGYVEDGFRVGKAFIDELRSVEVYDELRHIDAPTLFVHGDADTDVPLEQSRRAVELVSAPSELHVVGGADHCFRDEQDEVVDVTTTFLTRHS